MNELSIRDFEPAYQVPAAELINASLARRFGCRADAKNPDLFDIGRVYVDDCFLIALLDDQVVATGALIYESTFVTRIVRMHTAPGFRRRGVATALIRELERRAADHGARQVILESDFGWHDAHGFYRAAGYREFRRDEREIWFHKVVTPAGA
jgi:GNAT superfamily N-acetyltransferase